MESTSLSSAVIQEFLSCLRSLPEIAQQAKRLCDLLEQGSATISTPSPNIDAEDAAIAALARFGPKMTAIAEYVGVDRSTLYRSEGYKEFRRLYEVAKQEAEHRKESRKSGGYKSKDGDFDAWE
jgi:hypothetical protein